jgi:ferric-dicitrate binding protein FerR (iron transport regulator)
MSHHARRLAQQDVSRQAALWYWKLQSPQLPASEWEAYRAWHAVPEHRAAFASVAMQWEQVPAPDGAASDSVEPLWRALVCSPDNDSNTSRCRTMPSLQELFDTAQADDMTLTETQSLSSSLSGEESSPNAESMPEAESPQVANQHARILNEEAAYWYVVCTDDDQTMLRSDRREFVLWMRRGPENIDALLRVAQIDGKHRRLQLVLGALGLVGSAPSELYRDLAERYDATGQARPPIRPTARARAFRMLAMGATLALVSLLIFIVLLVVSYDGVISTGPSEQRQVVLEDGTRVFLNTGTRVKVEFGETARVVHMDYGEAVFDVGTRRDVPFIARTPLADAMTAGARFSVSIDAGIRMTVWAGVVTVAQRAPHRALTLRAGNTVVISDDATAPRSLTTVDAQRRRLRATSGFNFPGMSQAEAAHELNLPHSMQRGVEDCDHSARPLDGDQSMAADSSESCAPPPFDG